tara:strand:- start:4715 stop:5749 length:1035 start_codon:yes stop_codon:yes gene_type:complete
MRKIEILSKKFDSKLEMFLTDLSHYSTCVLGYHYPFYRDMLEHIGVGEPYSIGLFEDDEIVAYLPGFIKSSELGKVYSSLPFFGPNAGVLCYETNRVTYTNEITSYIIDYLDTNHFISASIYSPFMIDTEQEDVLYKDFSTQSIEKFTSYLALKDYAVSSKINYDIRKAEKSGITVNKQVTTERLTALFDIYQQNCRDFNIPLKPKECVNYLASYNSNNVSFYFAELNGKVIGALIMIWSESVASYYLPCSLNEHRTLQPNTLLINKAIEEAKERNLKIWNWESSTERESGVYKFKKKWGSTDDTYKIYIKVNKDSAYFSKLGQAAISNEFPNFYIYPFFKLNT